MELKRVSIVRHPVFQPGALGAKRWMIGITENTPLFQNDAVKYTNPKFATFFNASNQYMIIGQPVNGKDLETKPNIFCTGNARKYQCYSAVGMFQVNDITSNTHTLREMQYLSYQPETVKNCYS